MKHGLNARFTTHTVTFSDHNFTIAEDIVHTLQVMLMRSTRSTWTPAELTARLVLMRGREVNLTWFRWWHSQKSLRHFLLKMT